MSLQLSRYVDLASSWTIEASHPRDKKLFPLHSVQKGSGAHPEGYFFEEKAAGA
jgi:hypothetical protein